MQITVACLSTRTLTINKEGLVFYTKPSLRNRVKIDVGAYVTPCVPTNMARSYEHTEIRPVSGLLSGFRLARCDHVIANITAVSYPTADQESSNFAKFLFTPAR
jgi:hypothetical protein